MQHEAQIRLGFFAGVLAVMALWELLAPRRPLTASKARRWIANFGVLAVDFAVVRALLGAAAVTTATYAEGMGWGLFRAVYLPDWAVFAGSVVLLDFVVYLQHVMFHAIPVLWRFHMMHHADPDLDVSSGGRFHPVEIVLSMFIKMAAIALLGPPVTAVVTFEVLLNATAMFNHSNVRMPRGLDAVLRWLVVTPDMHRVHHSVDYGESNSNFGFNAPWWDRLLGTYRAQPAAGHEGMTIGLKQFKGVKRQPLWWLLVMPFTGRPGGYSINRRGISSS